jgi:hypothetical protein
MLKKLEHKLLLLILLVLEGRWEPWSICVMKQPLHFPRRKCDPNQFTHVREVQTDVRSSSRSVFLFAPLSVKNAITQRCCPRCVNSVSVFGLWPMMKGIGPVAYKLGMTAYTHLTALRWRSSPPLALTHESSTHVASPLFIKQVRRIYCKLITKCPKRS